MIRCEDSGTMVQGFRVWKTCLPPGSECEQLYAQMLDAYERLCIRLWVEDEDEDVETIISSLMRIERTIQFCNV